MVCAEPFDRKNKEQVKTWSVVVREKESVVRVYCPSCWAKAKEIIDQLNLNS
jgi:hypothetical protein